MNRLLIYIVYLYLLCSTVGVEIRKELATSKGLLDVDINVVNTTKSIESTGKPTRKIGEKVIKYVLMKMLMIAINKNNKCVCNCSKNVDVRTTEKNKIYDGSKNPVNMELVMRNNPENYSGINYTLSNVCPYFVPNEGLRMDMLADVFWPKFYNMKDDLNCFKISVLRLTDMQRKRNHLLYSTFGGIVDWSRCHFEIKPPDSEVKTRHFLLGDAEDRGVMRNILITAEDNGGFLLEEEAPDQWVMLRNLVLLRDCFTGEVVVFTRSPETTKTGVIIQALRDLGVPMVGKMLCDTVEHWLNDAS